MLITLRRYGLAAALCILLLGLPSSAAAAAAKKSADKPGAQSVQSVTGSVTQSYNADASVEIGMLVSLKPGDATTVVPFKGDGVKNLLGVTIPSNQATIVLTPAQAKSQQVLVTSTGINGLLVSNQNGPIKDGDYITTSAVSGIGMKADPSQETIVGRAAGAFSGNANVVSTIEIEDTLGHKVKLSIGRVPLSITIDHNPLFQKDTDNVPSFLVKVSTAISSKPVSAARIYLSLFIFLMTAIVTSNLLYSGVRSGMIAVGRNPLSKKSIIRSLIQTVIAGLIIFMAGIMAVYLLLKL